MLRHEGQGVKLRWPSTLALAGVHDALLKVQPLGSELVAVVLDEGAAHVQLDVVVLLLGPGQLEGARDGTQSEA